MRRETALKGCASSSPVGCAPGARLADRLLDLRRPSFSPEVGQVRTENAPAAPHHVAARAVARSREELFTGGGIAGGGVVGGRCLQDVDVRDDRIELDVGHGKRRHSGSGDPVANEIPQRRIRRGARLTAVDDVGALAAAGAIGAVATCAAGFIRFPASLERLRESARAGAREHG